MESSFVTLLRTAKIPANRATTPADIPTTTPLLLLSLLPVGEAVSAAFVKVVVGAAVVVGGGGSTLPLNGPDIS